MMSHNNHEQFQLTQPLLRSIKLRRHRNSCNCRQWYW